MRNQQPLLRFNKALGSSGIVITLLLAVLLMVYEPVEVPDTHGDAGPSAPATHKTVETVVPVPIAAVLRRLPVAGAEGYWIVVHQDGSSFLESPDGSQRQLTEPGDKNPETPEADLIAKRLEKAETKRQGIGQLVVCDVGVVDVPKDAVITFVGRDKVVTLDPVGGSSIIYYTDGRVERRGRADRRSDAGPAK